MVAEIIKVVDGREIEKTINFPNFTQRYFPLVPHLPIKNKQISYAGVESYAEKNSLAAKENVIIRISTSEYQCHITLRVHYQRQKINNISWSVMVSIDNEITRSAVVLDKSKEAYYSVEGFLESGDYMVQYNGAKNRKDDIDNHVFIEDNMGEWGLSQAFIYKIPFLTILRIMGACCRIYCP